jgi:hypothetical protein
MNDCHTDHQGDLLLVPATVLPAHGLLDKSRGVAVRFDGDCRRANAGDVKLELHGEAALLFAFLKFSKKMKASISISPPAPPLWLQLPEAAFPCNRQLRIFVLSDALFCACACFAHPFADARDVLANC